MSQYRILSLDGGGIRGIIPALVLAEIERRTGKRIAQLFDLIAGTSTGGILAATLAKPATATTPAFTALDLVDFYVKEGTVIFPKSALRAIVDLGGAAGPKFPDSGVEAVLKKYLGSTKLQETIPDILVCSYEIQQRQPWFFRTDRARKKPLQYDFPLWEVARCTSAAPTYFEPERITSGDGKSWALVDGGVFANDPGMCALADVKADDPACDVLLVSLGTGEHTRPIEYQSAKNWGLLQWAKPILDVVFDGVAKATDFQLEQMLPDVGGEARYFRFQTTLDLASDDMDDTDAENLSDLRQQAAKLIQDQQTDLDAVVAQLMRPRA